jgi:NitT/TauT family transport system permease protein
MATAALALAPFSPLRVISKRTVITIIIFWVLSTLLLWYASPFVFLPTMAETHKAFGELWDDGIAGELITSLFANVQAIGIATIVSLLLAYSAVIPFFRPVVMFLSKLRFLSMVGLSFFFTVIAHTQHQLKIYLLVFSVSVFFLTGMADVIASIPKEQFDLARTLRMGNWRVVWEVIVLGQADKAFDVLRQNAAIGWMMLTMVEGMTRSEGGIGALLLNANKHFYLPAVMAIQLSILVLGLGQDYGLGLLKKLFCPYADLGMEKK